MAHVCPKDGQTLATDARYGEVCGRCRAVLVADETLETRHPSALSLMQVESDERAPVFALGYQCPGCRHMLAPWRIPASSAHAFRCVNCGWGWLPPNALDALMRQLEKKAAADAYRSLPEAGRQE